MAGVTWLGHASFEIELGNSLLYVDPWFDQKPRDWQRLVPSAVSNVDNIRKADLILITHEHFDHCDPYDVTRMVQRTFAQVVGPEEALAKIPDIPPRRKVFVNEGDSFVLQGVEINVVEARHPASVHPVGYVLSKDGKSVYHAGDTYDFHGMSNIDVDLALLPIGGTFTMDVLGAVSALKKMRASFAVPMHYNTFDRIKVDPDEFVRRVRASTKSVSKLLQVGQTFQF